MSDLTEDLDRFESIATRLLESQPGKPQNILESNTHVSTGGLGLWISATCCAVMLAVTILFVIFVSILIEGQNSKIGKLEDQIGKEQDYLNAIYVQAPQLKPKELKK